MRRLAVAGVATLVLVGMGIWAITSKPRQLHRVDDRAGLLDSSDIEAFESYLESIEYESGVDIRFVFVDSLVGETLEQFAVRTARAQGIGQNLDRRGILLAYDVRGKRLRIEVGPTLQGIFPDGFVGYLMHEQLHSYFTTKKYASLGLRRTVYMLQTRLRRAELGDDYDPRPAAFIADRRRLAIGGGASEPTDSA
ncbi:MAG TPA: TPM domain-containing protein, partial [Gemmatimonadales bacterium]|nr:TPM domain-containing protein [Gemmatimonadales bacterium]